ncbi:E3 ubiquitin protein ligase-like protein [Tanacetum coccineum]
MFNFLRNLADVLEKSSFGFMGILFCCIRPRVDEDDDFVPNEAIRASNGTNNRSGDDSTSSLLRDISNRSDNVLARGATDDKRLRSYSQVEPQQRKPEQEPKPEPQEQQEPQPQQQLERVLVSEPKQEPQPQRQQEHVHVSEPKQEPILESQEPKPEPEQIQEPVLESEGLIIHKSIQRGEYVQHNKEECFICFEVYTIEQPKTRFKCSHYCHLGCILAWQEISALCPMCLKVLELDDEEEKSDPETLLPSTSQA